MSYSYALPGERFSSGLSRRWLFACTLSQLICLGALSGGGVLAQRMQWLSDSPEMIALHLATAAIFGLTFGYLRGCVLRTGLARFRWRCFVSRRRLWPRCSRRPCRPSFSMSLPQAACRPLLARCRLTPSTG